MNSQYSKYLFFLVAYLLLVHYGYAQIVDDSTKLIYGPRTTKYVREEDIFTNSGNLHEADTSINDFHNVYNLYEGKLVYQNLGNFGTPLNPVYYQAPKTIGKDFGYHSFDLYAFDPGKIKYYDTRSPYTYIHYFQGGTGQQMGDAVFARNIRPNWNFGFEIKRLTSNKLFGATQQRERLADHTSFLIATRYYTKDSVYQVLANYTFLDHKIRETGGVRRKPGETSEQLFGYRTEDSYLETSRTFEKRSGFHLYHQLSLPRKEFIQLFHVFDYSVRNNRFRAENLAEDTLFYPDRMIKLPAYYIGTATLDRSEFILLENKAGIKGLAYGAYYQFYLRRRDFSYRNVYEGLPTRRFNENFAGGNLSYRINKKMSVNASGEYMVTSNYLPKGERDYFGRAEFISEFVTGGFYRINHSPTLLQLNYNGNNLRWNHIDTLEFGTILSDNLYANGNIKWKSLTVSPGANVSKITNYVYYNTLAEPQQDTSAINVLSFDLSVKLNWRWLNIENFVKYTEVSKPSIIQVPEIYNHLRIYYSGEWFKNALRIQAGFDVFWRSDYYAYNYMPITQQFYQNNYFPVENYILADLFLNVQVKRTNGFVRFSHINQGIMGPGYFSTPYYPGLPRNFEFGIKWNFFD